MRAMSQSRAQALRVGRAVTLSAMLALCVGGPASGEAKLTARDVAKKLFQQEATTRPDLVGRDLRELDLSGLDFRRARLAGSDLFGADLTRSDLSGADLHGARLDRAVIIGAQFSGADLSNASLLLSSAVSSLVYVANEAPRFRDANLSGATIVAHLSGSDFRGANLTAAIFNHADMRGTLMTALRAELVGCDLTGAILRRTDMSGIVMRFAKLRGADLTSAVLIDVDLSKADLTGADLTGANLSGVDFDGAILTGVKGLSYAQGLDRARNFDRAIR